MVFELTDGLARCPEERWRELALCISNLLIGYYEGNLILSASYVLCRFLELRKLAEGYREKLALQHLMNNNEARPAVLWHIRVVLDSPNVNDHELDITFFNKTESIQPSSFLCEHIFDIRFYMRQAMHYYPNSYMIAIERSGGGGATVDVFKSIKSRCLICLTILDSDCKYPGSRGPPIGSTAYRCEHSYTTKKTNIELLILPVHEVENLIPLSFIYQSADADGRKFLKRLEKQGVQNHMIYYDVKRGIIKEDAAGDSGLMAFAKNLYDDICQNRQSFEAYFNHKKPKEHLHPAFGEDILKEYLDDKFRVYQPDMFDTYRKSIADLVHTFFCCRGFNPINEI